MILSSSTYLKYRKLLTAIALLFIVLGTFNKVFSLLAFLTCVFNILLSRGEGIINMLVFLLPFSSIFKFNPGEQSFFTYVTLFYILYMILNHKITQNFFICLILLITTIALHDSTNFDLFRSIKFIANILLTYSAMKLNPQNSHKEIFLSFVHGIIVSSFLSLPGVLPNFSEYVTTKDLGFANDWLERFSGMYGDPNYYSINVIISICLLVLLWHKREIPLFFAVGLSSILVYFAIITYSKSAFIMLALPLILFLYSNIKNKKYFLAALFLVGMIYVVVLLFAGRISAFAMVLSRFTEGSGDITTGRSHLWSSYLSLFIQQPLVLLFGRGLGAEFVNGMAPHNTYIDFLYFLGLVGTVIYIITIFLIPKSKIQGKRNFLNFSIFICIGAMYFFISEIFYIDFPFHIIIALIAYNLSFNKCE